MANAQHLDLLDKGAVAWNSWRHSESNVPDLSGANLSRRHFVGFDFSDADLSGANFEGSNLERCSLEGAFGRGVDFRNARLSYTNAERLEIDAGKFSRAQFGDVGFHLALFVNCTFERVHMFDCDFHRAGLRNCAITESMLTDVRFHESLLADVILTDTTISGVVFAKTPLQNVRGLAELKHGNPSSIGIDTFFMSGGLPDAFLRGAGVSDMFIEYGQSMTTAPIAFNSCFISYSSHDDKFVKRLHHDLQAIGTRTWFAPHDLKIGDKFRSRIEESIRLHDKVLLVLSKNSIASRWVETEVEATFDRERLESRDILFPIRLDDAIFRCTEAWAAAIRRTRQIGDFSGWKKRTKYDHSFGLLYRSLRRQTVPS